MPTTFAKLPSSLLASSDIGQTTALLLAESGVQVAWVSRRGDSVQQLADRILKAHRIQIIFATQHF